ncbi:MAG: response regulator [Candidatus Thermoplasmatota archaeon]
MATRVFIVDDDPAIVGALKAVLEMGGVEIAGYVYDGGDALSRFKEISPPPDVVIMDYWLPVMNGIDVMAEIIRAAPSVRVLFVSADTAARNAAIAAGAAGFLPKPFGIAELLAAVQNLAKGQAD